MGQVMYLVSFDPGETTGVAEFNEEGDLRKAGQFRFKELVDYCENLSNVEYIVCEDFRIRRSKATKFVGNRMETIQAIGVIRAAAQRLEAEFILQDSSILPIAQKWTQVPLPKDHSASHWISAFNHGAYWLIRRGERKVALEHDRL
jgi:hypothetical protein